jgi:hypothetical protein
MSVFEGFTGRQKRSANSRFQRTALRAAAEPERWAACGHLPEPNGRTVIPTLHLMCGLPCSGKTTLARQLASTHRAVRLTPDEWHTRLFGQDADSPEHDVRHSVVESLQWEVAVQVLYQNVDVILDFGFWSKSEREDYRSRGDEIGAEMRIHYLNVPEKNRDRHYYSEK